MRMKLTGSPSEVCVLVHTSHPVELRKGRLLPFLLPATGKHEIKTGNKWQYAAWGKIVKDYKASIEKLRRDAAEAALIRDLATDPVKRDIFDRLYRHLNLLADEIEQAMKSSAAE
jgi:hypothetical protein